MPVDGPKRPSDPIYIYPLLQSLNALDHLCSFGVELRSIPVVTFLLALFTKYRISQKYITETYEPPSRLSSWGASGITYVL
jgi:hypothetical protein